jgi:Transglycosylase SLT domain
LEQMLRRAALVATALLAVGGSVAGLIQQRTPAHPIRPVANVATFSVLPRGTAIPMDVSGRVMRWQNERLMAQEAAAAAAAAAAQAEADRKAKAAAAARRAATPTPTPAPPAAIPSYPAGSVQDIIIQAFTPYGSAAVAWGLRVAKCESGYNPRAYNGAGPYYGLFQFLMSTFRATPYGGQDIYDPVANASAAAWKYGQGGAGAWGCR